MTCVLGDLRLALAHSGLDVPGLSLPGKAPSSMLRDRPPVSRDIPRPDSLQATEHLRFIRDVMDRSAPFTAVPGRGLVVMGVTALLAAYLAHHQPTLSGWLRVWVVEAAVAGAIGFVTLRHKVHTVGLSLRSGPGRKYVQSLLPPLAAGALLTLALYLRSTLETFFGYPAAPLARYEVVGLLPGIWLLLYGAGTVTGGLASISLVPRVGLAFMALGTAALFLPPFHANVLMAVGFGGLHLLAGVIVWKRYGG